MSGEVSENHISLIAFRNTVERIGDDNSLHTTHISLLTAIFICWQGNKFQSPFMVSRRMLMAYSKIASKTTYHKCLGELLEKGYIDYKPSFHPRLASVIWWRQIERSDIKP